MKGQQTWPVMSCHRDTAYIPSAERYTAIVTKQLATQAEYFPDILLYSTVNITYNPVPHCGNSCRNSPEGNVSLSCC